MMRLLKYFVIITVLVGAVAFLAAGVVAVKLVKYASHHPGSFHFNSLSSRLAHQGESAHETLEKRFKADRVESLQVSSHAGDITVETATDDTIRVLAEKTASGPASPRQLQQYLSRVSTTVQLEGSVLRVETTDPSPPLPDGISVSVSYRLYAPGRLSLSLTSTSGALKATGFRGGTFTSGDGNIDLASIGGDIHASADNGAITASDIQPSRGLELSTENGSVQATHVTASGSALPVRLTSANGNIEYSGDASAIDARSGSGSVQVRLTDRLPATGGSITSENGSVDVQIAPGASVAVAASSGNGSVSVSGSQFTREKSEASDSTTAVLGTGAGHLRVHSDNGSVGVHTD